MQEYILAPLNFTYQENMKFYKGFYDAYMPEYIGNATGFELIGVDLKNELLFNTTTGMLYGTPDTIENKTYEFIAKVYNAEYYNEIPLKMEVIRKSLMFINRTTVYRRYII